MLLIHLAGHIKIGQPISIIHPELDHSGKAKLLAANVFFTQVCKVAMINLNMTVDIVYTRVFPGLSNPLKDRHSTLRLFPERLTL